MADEVKLYEDGRSPYVSRVKIALNIKGIEFQSLIEDLGNKCINHLNHNPVYKKVPTLVHNGNPISESLVIIEYIDDFWKGVSILPQDPYDKADVRFWAKFIADTCLPAIYQVCRTRNDQRAIEEAYEKLQILENKLQAKDKLFLGGDNINLVDIAAVFIAYWPDIIEEASGMKLVPKDKFPKLTEWADNFVNLQVVKESLPSRAHLLDFFISRYSKV